MPETVKTRVLLVDDSAELREAFRLLLEDDGFVVMTAEDADSAFALVAHNRPDVVVTDIMLGGPQGLDLISRIRSDLAPPVPPIIAWSGFRDFGPEALKRGAVAFLVKPVDLEDLSCAIEAGLEHRPPDVHQASVAAQHTQELRQETIEAAESAVRRIEEPELIQRRIQLAARWLPTYLGFGELVFLLIHNGELTVRACGGTMGDQVRAPGPTWLALARDVLESRSVLVLPDATRFVRDQNPHGPPIRLFLGLPVIGPGNVAIGAICLYDETPRHIEPDDLTILEEFARRASMVYGGLPRTPAEPPIFTSSGMLARGAFEALLRLELSRTQRDGLVMELGVLKLEPGTDVDPVRSELSSHLGARRRAIAELMDDTVGFFVVREEPAKAYREVIPALESLRGHGLTGASSLAVEGSGLPVLSAQTVLHLAEAMVARNTIDAETGADRMVLRRERWGAPVEAHPA